VVVGVTNEAEGVVKKWIDEKKATYAIAIVEGKAIDEAYGVKGFPSSYLVSAQGEIVWIGHPANLPEADLEAALERAVVIPKLPEKYGAISADLAKKNYGKAHAALVKELAKGANEALAKAKDAIERLAADRLLRAETAATKDDYAAGQDLLLELTSAFKGLEASETAARKLKEWKADKAIKAKIRAGEDLARAAALEKLADPAAKQKALKIYLDVAKQMKGGPLGERAQAAAERLKGS
jgi:hypothetical protein